MASATTELNELFQALADPTRRAVLRRLGQGPVSVGELAEPFDMALPSFMKHIHILEQSRLITTRKSGRVRTCVLERERFALVNSWLDAQRAVWERHADRLEQFVTTASKESQ